MPAPTPYNRQFNFTNYQAVNPATPLPATPLDNELSSVKVSLDSLISNLGLIQRSDGQLANASVGPQQLQPSILAGISPPTQWSGAGVSYQVGATVFSGLLFYVCNTANVSSAGNPPATFAAWTLLADFSGVSIPAGSVTSAAFAPGAVNSAALGANLALPGSPTTGDNSTSIATTAFVDAQVSSMLTGFKNRVINGAMAIDQRNSGASGTAAAYTVDRWRWAPTVGAKATWQQQTASPAPGFPFYLNIASNGAYTLLTTDSFDIRTTIEAFDIYDLQMGSAGAKPVTLSFWVKATATGTFGGSLRNGAGTRSYPFTYTISAANTWQQVSVTIPGDTGGTWANSTNAAGLVVGFNLGAGSTFQGTANTWQTGNFTTSAGTTQIAGVASASFAFTGVSLQVGPGAATTPFEFRSYSTELVLCQRYFQTGQLFMAAGSTAIGQAAACSTQTPVVMRSTATMAITANNNVNFSFGTLTHSATPNNIFFANGTCAAAGAMTINTAFTANADF